MTHKTIDWFVKHSMAGWERKGGCHGGKDIMEGSQGTAWREARSPIPSAPSAFLSAVRGHGQGTLSTSECVP
jgi:hypothetical protein